MRATLQGQENGFERACTGYFSLDFLLSSQNNEVGIPLRTTMELYGPAGHGKSTISQFLAGKVAAHIGATQITIADLETALEEQHLISTVSNAGFSGVVRIVESVDKKRKPRTHEEILQETVDSLLKPEVGVIIIDSLGMIMPRAEMENPLGSANMGRRAQLVAQMNRRILNHLRIVEPAKLAIQVNHQYASMGGMGKGRVTPGGDSKGYAAAVRLSIWRMEIFKDGSSLVSLRTDKLRYGGVIPDRKGFLFVIPGYGVSMEMTYVFDAIAAGIAKRGRSGVTIGDEHFGHVPTLIRRAKEGQVEYFLPFFEALQREFTAPLMEEEPEDGETTILSDEVEEGVR